MSISALNPSAVLQAQNAYSTTSAQKAKLPEAEMTSLGDIKATESFQKMVNKNFNSFAKMNPAEIIAFSKQIQNAGAASVGSDSNVASTMFSTVSSALRKDEDVKRRSIVNEASLTEVIAATSEAKAVLQTAVAVRNKVLAAFEDIMKMPL